MWNWIYQAVVKICKGFKLFVIMHAQTWCRQSWLLRGLWAICWELNFKLSATWQKIVESMRIHAQGAAQEGPYWMNKKGKIKQMQRSSQTITVVLYWKVSYCWRLHYLEQPWSFLFIDWEKSKDFIWPQGNQEHFKSFYLPFLWVMPKLLTQALCRRNCGCIPFLAGNSGRV